MNIKWFVEDAILKKDQGIILLINKSRTRARLVWLYGQPILGRKNK
jgi:hypothetical protein